MIDSKQVLGNLHIREQQQQQQQAEAKALQEESLKQLVLLQEPHQSEVYHLRCFWMQWFPIRNTIFVVFVAATFGDIMTATVASLDGESQEEILTEVDVMLNAYIINNSVLMEINSSSETESLLYNENPFDLNNTNNYIYINKLGSNYNNYSNDTYNVYEKDDTQSVQVLMMLKVIVLVIVLGLMILVTVIGNVIVIAAIILERNLQNVANYLVVSLAVADLFVAGLVMPLGAVYEISDGWILGAELCDIWTSCDVLCCTASILHLVAIAADRYWTVTNIDYHNIRTPRRVFFMIFLVWFTSLIISLAPQFGWKDPEYMTRIENQECMVSQDVSYQIFATCCTFYVPLLVILFLYWKIYKIARKRIQRRAQRSVHTIEQKHQTETKRTRRRHLKACFGRRTNSEALANQTMDTTAGKFTQIMVAREETEFSTSNFASHAGTDVTNLSSDADEIRNPNAGDILSLSHHVASTTQQQQALASHLNSIQPSIAPGKQHQPLSILANPHQKLAKRRQMLEAKRERKAAQTLAIITGAFVVCWLPFFLMALLLPLCKTCHINATMASFILWLGYFNSTLNPIIYTIFNPEFRRAFKRILCGRQQNVARCRSSKI